MKTDTGEYGKKVAREKSGKKKRATKGKKSEKGKKWNKVNKGKKVEKQKCERQQRNGSHFQHNFSQIFLFSLFYCRLPSSHPFFTSRPSRHSPHPTQLLCYLSGPPSNHGLFSSTTMTCLSQNTRLVMLEKLEDSSLPGPMPPPFHILSAAIFVTTCS